jgi:hypothetical protein
VGLAARHVVSQTVLIGELAHFASKKSGVASVQSPCIKSKDESQRPGRCHAGAQKGDSIGKAQSNGASF